MKISELQLVLLSIEKEHGDIDVVGIEGNTVNTFKVVDVQPVVNELPLPVGTVVSFISTLFSDDSPKGSKRNTIVEELEVLLENENKIVKLQEELNIIKTTGEELDKVYLTKLINETVNKPKVAGGVRGEDVEKFKAMLTKQQ